MKSFFKPVFLIQIMILLSSCGENALYDEQFTIENGQWPKDKAIHFEVEVPDTITPYDFYLIVRHTNNYRYSNIYFFLNTDFPNNNKTRDTIECILANNEGKWLGKGWGEMKEDDILLNKNMHFPVTGKYDFYFIQAMRQDTLKDIVSLGLKIVEAQQY